MKKVLLGLFCAMSLFANAQSAGGLPVKNWEWELKFGGTLPLSGGEYSKAQLGPALGAEVRYNLEDSPLSLGAKIDVTVARKDISEPSLVNMPKQPEETLEMGYRTFNFSVLGDYNFRQGRNVYPFVGVGLGIGMQHECEDAVYDNDGHAALAFTPRVGVELFRHVRIACTATITKKDYSNIAFTLGYVFGGGKR